jgi:hypothetical protein
VISAAENSNKFPKTRLWKEKAVEDAVTLVPMARATLYIYIYIYNVIVKPYTKMWQACCMYTNMDLAQHKGRRKH